MKQLSTNWRLGALVLAAVLGSAAPAGADGGAQASSCPDAGLIADQGNLARIDTATLCLINQERSERGIRPLHRSSELDQSASFQSADMVSHHYFSHDHAGRPSLLQRVLWTGYFARARTGLYAENLGYGPQQTTSPAVMVDAWMSSPDHEANILDRRLRDIGLGAALAPPDPAFYANYPALVLTTDFGMRVFAARSCLSAPAARPPSPTASPERRVCSSRLRRRRRRRVSG